MDEIGEISFIGGDGGSNGRRRDGGVGGGGGNGGIGGWTNGDNMGLVLAPRIQAGPISIQGDGIMGVVVVGGGLVVGEEVGATGLEVVPRLKIVAISL